MFMYICVFRLSPLVSVSPQKCSLVWNSSKHEVAHNPMLHSQHLNFVLVSLFLAEHTQQRILLHCIISVWLCDHGLPCLACRMLLLWQQKDWTVELKIDISMNLKFKKVRKKFLQQSEGHLPLVPCCTNQSNECLYAFLTSPTDCIWTHLTLAQDKPALPHTMTCTASSKFYKVSTYSRAIWKE
jgi:hypothetical protein